MDATAIATDTSSSPTPTARPFWSIITLCLGALSLMLSVGTTITYDIPPPWKEVKPQEPRLEGQKQVEWHGFKFRWGGKPVKEEEKAPGFTVPKILFLSSAVISVIGLLLGSLALYREHRIALVVPAMILCFAALVWQYLIFGILLGAAVAIFCLILSMFG